MSARRFESKLFFLVFALALFAFAATLPQARPAAAQGWRTYVDPMLGFRILYPGEFRIKRLGRDAGGGIFASHEWSHTDGKTVFRLNIIERPEGLTLADWIKREYGGRAVEHTIAGQPAYIHESLFEGQLNTDVFVIDPKSGKIVNFAHSVRGVVNPEGKPINAVKNRYRAQLTDFWNMVESIKFDDPALKNEPKIGTE